MLRFWTRLTGVLCIFAASHHAQTPVPSQLVGKWTLREGSGTSYRDSRTGQFSAPNANTYTYTISANGRFEHAALLSSSLYQCTMQMFGFETGRVEVAGDRIAFTDLSATIRSVDSCRPQWNYEKGGNLTRTEYAWRLAQDEFGQKLILLGRGGKEDAYYRQ